DCHRYMEEFARWPEIEQEVIERRRVGEVEDRFAGRQLALQERFQARELRQSGFDLRLGPAERGDGRLRLWDAEVIVGCELALPAKEPGRRGMQDHGENHPCSEHGHPWTGS